MNDFDAVLERLVSDPEFSRALAQDPARALAGYRLSDEERQLLSAQVDSDSGNDRTVEIRTTKSSTLGLFGGIAAGMGLGAGAGAVHSAGVETVGSAPGGDESVGRALAGTESFGPALTSSESVGVAVPEATEAVGRAAVPAENYAPRVDIDGDGTFDKRLIDDNGDGWLDRSERLDPS